MTWQNSVLVSFDPRQGSTLQKHLQLNPHEAFRGLAFDPNHRKLYALAQVTQNLYEIDVETGMLRHIGNLRIDRRGTRGLDAGALAYDPVSDVLFTSIEHWENWNYTGLWSELCRIDTATAAVERVGRIDGPFVDSLAHSGLDGQLYGLAIYGSGPWDSPFKSHLVRIDPATAAMSTLFETPYHTMMGLAGKEPSSFFSWINWTTHFYGQVDLFTRTITQLGDSDPVGVISAMVYRDFPLASETLPLPATPASFVYSGHVLSLWDPQNSLAGRIKSGHRFSGEFSYDIAAPYKQQDPDESAPYGITMRVGGMEFFSQGLLATVRNNYFNGWDRSVSDRFDLSAVTEQNAVLSWTLVDSTAAALDGNKFLPDGFDLPGWQGNEFVLTGLAPYGNRALFRVVGKVDHAVRTQGNFVIPPGWLGAAGSSQRQGQRLRGTLLWTDPRLPRQPPLMERGRAKAPTQ